jgi:hypothetical protein
MGELAGAGHVQGTTALVGHRGTRQEYTGPFAAMTILSLAVYTRHAWQQIQLGRRDEQSWQDAFAYTYPRSLLARLAMPVIATFRNVSLSRSPSHFSTIFESRGRGLGTSKENKKGTQIFSRVLTL